MGGSQYSEEKTVGKGWEGEGKGRGRKGHLLLLVTVEYTNFTF